MKKDFKDRLGSCVKDLTGAEIKGITIDEEGGQVAVVLVPGRGHGRVSLSQLPDVLKVADVDIVGGDITLLGAYAGVRDFVESWNRRCVFVIPLPCSAVSSKSATSLASNRIIAFSCSFGVSTSAAQFDRINDFLYKNLNNARIADSLRDFARSLFSTIFVPSEVLFLYKEIYSKYSSISREVRDSISESFSVRISFPVYRSI